MTSIVVAGALAAKPGNAGEAWVRLSYVIGLRRLGFDVFFLEQATSVSADGVSWFREIETRYGLAAALVDGRGDPILGSVPERADVLLNISGNVRGGALLARFRRRAYIDLDPGFTQVWQAAGEIDVRGHHVYFTVGENIGRAGCPIPTDGVTWRATRPPVVLDAWPPYPNAVFDRFTTVATWRPGHGAITVAGRSYGLRVHAFRRLADLPVRSRLPFEAALSIDKGEGPDLEMLRMFGWRLVDPREVAPDPAAFRTYVASSGSEFSVAQEAYTEAGTGWLSDRTTRYLASGRPALVDDTGQRAVPTGEGLVTFRTPAEARAGASAIVEDYDRHSRAARALAETYFDSEAVLTRLLEDVL